MAAPSLIQAIAALGGLARADSRIQQMAQWSVLQTFLLDLEQSQKALVVIGPDLLLSFDDGAIGFTDSTRRSVKQRTSIENPFATNLEWYGYAGKILALVRDEILRALQPIRSAYIETFGCLAAGADLDAQIIETIRDTGGTSDLVAQLDVALNGEAGAVGHNLAELVAQVTRQQASVRILNFTDGMRLNFRADGKAFTWNISAALAGQEDEGACVLRAAIRSYPMFEPLPTVLDDFNQDGIDSELQGECPRCEGRADKMPCRVCAGLEKA